MNSSLATFLKVAVTVVVIAAMLFSVGYQMLIDESKHYDGEIVRYKNPALHP